MRNAGEFLQIFLQHSESAMNKLIFMVCLLLLTAPVRLGAQVVTDGFYTEPFIVPGMTVPDIRMPNTNMHTAVINSMDADTKGRFLVTGSDDKSIRVWSRETHHMLRAIRVRAGPGFTGRIFAVALSPDGNTIAAGGFTDVRPTEPVTPEFHIYLFDRATGRQVGLFGGLPGVVNQLAFSPDGRRLAAALGGMGGNGVWLFDTTTMHKIAFDAQYGDSCRGVAFSPDGRLVTTSFDGQVRLYSPDLQRLRVVGATAGPSPFGVAFDPDGRLIAVGYFGIPRVDVLDGTTLHLVRRADTSGVTQGDLSKVAWSPDGSRLFAAGSWQRNGQLPVRIWSDAGRRVLGDYPAARNTITALHPLADGAVAIAAGDPRLALLGRNGLTEWAIDPKTVDYREQSANLAVSPDGTKVRFFIDRARSAQVLFNLRKRQLDIDPPADPTLRPARLDGPAFWRNTTAPTMAGKALSLDTRETSRSIASTSSGDSFALGAEWSLNLFKRDGTRLWRIQTPGVVWAVNIPANGHVVVAAYSDGTIRWHRLSDGAELLAFYPHADGRRWVAWTPLGHYVASLGGEALIEWQINKDRDTAPEVFSATRFRDRFYRPDVVERVINELDPIRALTAADRESGRVTVTKSIASDTPPRITIVDPYDNTWVEQQELEVAYYVEDRPGTLIQRVELLLGGRLVASESNLTIPASGHLDRQLRARLEGPGTVLSLIATSSISSDPATVQIHRPNVPAIAKPNLYVLAIGIAKFETQRITPLSYTEDDAKAFVEHMTAQEGANGLYQKVLSLKVIPPAARNQDIREGLDWLNRNVQKNDVVVIFISTHGRNDSAGDFYLLPYDVSLDDESAMQRTAVPYRDVTKQLARLSKRGPTLVFLDACHSGNVTTGPLGRAVDANGAVADMEAPENGIVVFSSSGGTQSSYEAPQLKHGLFTYALLEALEGKAPQREPPYLHASDLGRWLENEVLRLARLLKDQEQKPQTTQFLDDPRVFKIANFSQSRTGP